MERRYGIPKTDVERAMSHYNISEEEYLANPDAYPLPPRGTGLAGMGWGTLLVLGLLIWAATRRR